MTMTDTATQIARAGRARDQSIARATRLEYALDDARQENRLLRNELKAVRQDRDRLVGQLDAYRANGKLPPEIVGYTPEERAEGERRLNAATAERTHGR